MAFSKANYKSKNVAPLMEFFTSSVIVASQNNTITKSSITFQYNNKTTTIKHPTAEGDAEYVSPSVSSIKSGAVKQYEVRAKKSKRLDKWRKQQGVSFKYFQ